MFLPHFDVFCDLLLNRRTATLNLFVLYNNETPFLSRKAVLLPRLCSAFARKKPFDVIYDLYKMNQFHWLLCVAKNCDWSRKITPLPSLTRAPLLFEWKLTAKEELKCEIYKTWRKCLKNQVSFCHRSCPVSRRAWTLPWTLQELKKYPRKTCGCVQPRGLISFPDLLWLPRGHLIRVLNERRERKWRWRFLSSVVGDSQINLI